MVGLLLRCLPAQQVLLMGITAPLYTINFVSDSFSLWDLSFAAICLLGLTIAYFADTQLNQFVSANEQRQRQGKPKELLLDSGLWR